MKIDYQIYNFSGLNNELDSLIRKKELNKIYLLNVDKIGIGIALRIRENDNNSIIIFISQCECYQKQIFDNKLMAFDFVCRDNLYEERVVNDILLAIKIIANNKMFVFKYNHVIYRIPYSQINYIEKEPLIKRCIIHATSDDYYVINSINDLINKLSYGFIRTHQSCIVNVNNINSINLSNNIITFRNGDKTNLLVDRVKKEVINYIELIDNNC